MRNPWTVELGSGPLLASAIHNGHEMLPELARRSALSVEDRLREEDPHTGVIATAIPTSVVVSSSRFTVDLNRRRESAVYREPEDAWGLDLWAEPPTDSDIGAALRIYDDFYGLVGGLIESTIDQYGQFVLYDVHSYNHRRTGPGAPPADVFENPTVNLGTESLPGRWRPVADAFISVISQQEAGGERIDARENVRFKGGYLARWVHDHYGSYGCALAIEFKKVFMDEWSGDVDWVVVGELEAALAETATPVIAALETV